MFNNLYEEENKTFITIFKVFWRHNLRCFWSFKFYIWPVAYWSITLQLCYRSQYLTQQEVPGARVIWYVPCILHTCTRSLWHRDFAILPKFSENIVYSLDNHRITKKDLNKPQQSQFHWKLRLYSQQRVLFPISTFNTWKVWKAMRFFLWIWDILVGYGKQDTVCWLGWRNKN